MSSTLEHTLARIRGRDRQIGDRVRTHLDTLTKPPGSLGRLEALAIELAEIRGEAFPDITPPGVLVFAAENPKQPSRPPERRIRSPLAQLSPPTGSRMRSTFASVSTASNSGPVIARAAARTRSRNASRASSSKAACGRTVYGSFFDVDEV